MACGSSVSFNIYIMWGITFVVRYLKTTFLHTSKFSVYNWPDFLQKSRFRINIIFYFGPKDLIKHEKKFRLVLFKLSEVYFAWPVTKSINDVFLMYFQIIALIQASASSVYGKGKKL